ncbi:MAG: hypothetical protein ACRCTY_00945 [Candidatus Adiutrix sp.]
MKRISIEQVKPGQVVAQKIQRSDGVLLVGQGTEVTDGLIRLLGRMNIDSIVIEEDNPQSPEEIEESFQTKVAALEMRFQRGGDQSILLALKAALLGKAKEERDEALAALIPEATSDNVLKETGQ